ncbi:MAG TPA: TAT-variant-translocated molybdopterin oxidoreductase, partial [Anaerolineaceae bacterium]
MTDTQQDERNPLNLATMRQRLAAKKGKEYWRSLNELVDSDSFDDLVRQEFPRQANLLDGLSRRDFLKVLGASLALAGLAACVPQSQEKILPYTKPPEELIPGKPIYFASAMVQDGYAKGVLIETNMGRPTKVEGLPNHPASLGATDIFMQASLLELYDPDRASKVTNKGTAKTWADFTGALGGLTGNLGQGAGLRILTGLVTSPTLNDQLAALLKKYPQAKWVTYSPVMGAAQSGTSAFLKKPFAAAYNFSKADVILSLDSDFLFSEPGHLRYSHDFGQRHQPISAAGTMSRLYMVESGVSITGANADHRLAVQPTQVEAFARAIAAKLGVNAGAPGGTVPGQDWLDPLAADLKKAGANALVIAGERQSAQVQALAVLMNAALGSVGNTFVLQAPVAYNQVDPNASLKQLVADLNSGAVDLLVILEGNPAYAAPADLDFTGAMKKARQSVYLGLYADETAAQSSWFIPAAHDMEMWSDARAYDGTISLVQPVIEPLYDGVSPHELLAALAGQGSAKGYDIVRAYWQGQVKGADFERAWKDALSKGIAPAGAAAPATQAADLAAAADQGALNAAMAAPAGGLQIVFQPDETIWDGRFANNSWMQELPKPLTKLTWDNAALLSPATAARLGMDTGDMVTLKLRGRSVNAPVYIQPGQADDTVIVSLGYGRSAGGNVLAGTGFNAYAIRTSDAPWFDQGVEVTKTGAKYPLAATHEHWSMENRDLIREATLDEYNQPGFSLGAEGAPVTLYDTFETPGYSWGMSINLNTCIGCNACVIACQAENNIPVVGKEQVGRGREMHWIRVDRYYQGPPEAPEVYLQ